MADLSIHLLPVSPILSSYWGTFSIYSSSMKEYEEGKNKIAVTVNAFFINVLPVYMQLNINPYKLWYLRLYSWWF
jgi:hypothetical protein